MARYSKVWLQKKVWKYKSLKIEDRPINRSRKSVKLVQLSGYENILLLTILCLHNNKDFEYCHRPRNTSLQSRRYGELGYRNSEQKRLYYMQLTEWAYKFSSIKLFPCIGRQTEKPWMEVSVRVDEREREREKTEITTRRHVTSKWASPKPNDFCLNHFVQVQIKG